MASQGDMARVGSAQRLRRPRWWGQGQIPSAGGPGRYCERTSSSAGWPRHRGAMFSFLNPPRWFATAFGALCLLVGALPASVSADDYVMGYQCSVDTPEMCTDP